MFCLPKTAWPPTFTIAVAGSDRRRIAGLHNPVLESLRSGDVAAADAAIRNHFADARAMLANLWPGPASGATSQPPTDPAAGLRPPADPVPVPARAIERTR